MDLYGKTAKSTAQKATIFILQLLILFFAYIIAFNTFGSEIYSWFGIEISEGDLNRRIMIFAFSIFVLLRTSFTMIVFLKRRIPLEEVISIPLAFSLYYIGFAIFGYGSVQEIGIIDYLGIAIFFFGSYLNTYSELQRHIWKKKNTNKGKLYTSGLFKYSMHINYFGDLLWVIAYSMLTLNIYSVWIPVFLFLFFAFYNIPKLDQYLAGKYKAQFSAYRKKTKKFIPFIY